MYGISLENDHLEHGITMPLDPAACRLNNLAFIDIRAQFAEVSFHNEFRLITPTFNYAETRF